MTPDTSHHDSGDDGLDRLRAGLACGSIPVDQLRPLLELLDVLRRAGGAEDRAARFYPGTESLDLAGRYGYAAASLTPALRVCQTLTGAS